ncbi:hypothetical protein Q3G72_024173 [Acer saccharum]|nr:hypothetical protein Q3G72_024173 [Acer saccharum]
MAIAAVLSSAPTTNIRWFLWLFYFLSLFMSQSCLADHDQFNFNLGRHFNRKLCPGCSMKFELQPFFRDSLVSESMHLSASSNLERNGKKNRASKMYLSLSAAALVLIAVSSTWRMRRRDALFKAKIRNKAEAGFQGLPSVPFDVILKATRQFSDDKVLGNGSFGVVYKGQLDDGELIAVKRTITVLCFCFLEVQVKGLLKEKKLEQLADCDLQGNYIGEEVEELIEVALLCTQNTAMERPKMSKVVRMLEGDGLSERWEEWQKEEIIRQDFTYTYQFHNSWIVDSTSHIAPDELSGVYLESCLECAQFRSNGSKNMPLLELICLICSLLRFLYISSPDFVFQIICGNYGVKDKHWS